MPEPSTVPPTGPDPDPSPGDSRSVEDLEALARRRQKVRYLFFWGHTPPASGEVGRHVLSQWFPSPFELDGHRYPTAEHWMMAAKARLFGDEEAAARILTAGSPARAKALGREVRGYDDTRWYEHRFEIVVAGSVAKFGSDPGLRAYLVGTGDRVLVEASPRDRIWGIGLSADDPAAQDPARWRGQNLLGFALMEARSRLR